jgi:hypothetical protein
LLEGLFRQKKGRSEYEKEAGATSSVRTRDVPNVLSDLTTKTLMVVMKVQTRLAFGKFQ